MPDASPLRATSRGLSRPLLHQPNAVSVLDTKWPDEESRQRFLAQCEPYRPEEATMTEVGAIKIDQHVVVNAGPSRERDMYGGTVRLTVHHGMDALLVVDLDREGVDQLREALYAALAESEADYAQGCEAPGA